MIHLTDLPLANAILNATALALLVVGRLMIARRLVSAHRACMVSAFVVSMLFLASYLTYRFLGAEKKFGGHGLVRPVYFFILITHVTLAATVPLLATRTLYLGLRGRWESHRRWARWTFPIWAYVSVTGIVVYVLLFRIYGPTASTGASGV